MKKYLSVFLILFTLCLTSNVSAYDFDVNVGDQVIWAGDYVGNGGEFTWTLLDDGGRSNRFLMVIILRRNQPDHTQRHPLHRNRHFRHNHIRCNTYQ